MELHRINGEDVTVQVSGRGLIVASLRPEQVVAFIDLQGASAGFDKRVRMGPTNFELPPGLEVVQVEPPEIDFDLEVRRQAEVVVEPPRFEGLVPAGYQIETVVRPEKVRIIGPESAMGHASVRTEPVSLAELGPDALEKAVEVGLIVVPSTVRLVPGQPERARVTVRLRPEAGPRPPKPAPTEPADTPKGEPASPSTP